MFLQHHVLQRVLNYLWFMNGNSCLNKTSTTQQSNWNDTIFSPLDICRIFKYLKFGIYTCVFSCKCLKYFITHVMCQSLYNLSVYLRTREHATCRDLYPMDTIHAVNRYKVRPSHIQQYLSSWTDNYPKIPHHILYAHAYLSTIIDVIMDFVI